MDNQLVGAYSAVQTRVEGQAVALRRLAWMASSDHPFRLPLQWQVLVSSSYQSPNVSGLFYTKASSYLNLGLKKQLWNERATLSLKLNDVFSISRFRSTMQYNNVNLSWNNQWESRRLALSFTSKPAGAKPTPAAPAAAPTRKAAPATKPRNLPGYQLAAPATTAGYRSRLKQVKPLQMPPHALRCAWRAAWGCS